MIGFRPPGETSPKRSTVKSKPPGSIRSIFQSAWVRYDLFIILIMAALILGLIVGREGK